MVTIFQTTFSKEYSQMKKHEFRLKFYWFFPNFPINNIPPLVQMMAWQAIIWINVGMFYWRIYASLGINELKGDL